MVYYHPHTDSITAKNDVGGVVMPCGVWLVSSQQKTLTQPYEIMTQSLLHGRQQWSSVSRETKPIFFHCYN